jgi:hypothetical protein
MYSAESVKKAPLENLFPELPNIYLKQGMKSVSELYGQKLCVCVRARARSLVHTYIHVSYFELHVLTSC